MNRPYQSRSPQRLSQHRLSPQPRSRGRSQQSRFPAACILTGVLSLLLAGFALQLWRLDWRTPLAYTGDAIFYLMTIKGLSEGAWYLSNPHLSAPGGLDLRDFACADTLHFAVLKLFALCHLPFPASDTLFYLLSFPLAAICCLYALWRLGISLRAGVFCSVVYSLAPYHFMRGTSHLFLSMYYLVPLTLLAVVWLGGETSPLFQPDQQGASGTDRLPTAVQWTSRDLKLAALWCALLGLTNVYYPFFTAALLVVAGAYGAWNRRSRAPLQVTGVLLLAIAAGFLANLAPNIAYSLSHGANPLASPRSSADAEVFGLKITELLLPVSEHRQPLLSAIKDNYDSYGSTAPEDEDAALGLIGAIGFVGLLLHLLARRTRDGRSRLDDLAVYNVAAVLFGTVGGFGSLFAFAISPDIRCYNRLSIYISFFALAAVADWLDRQARRCTSAGDSTRLVLLMALALGIAVWDQCPRSAIPEYRHVATEWQRDARFTARIESRLPANSMVFQLPYVSFPGSPPVNKMGDYEQLRPYLHSQTLRWSYGAIRGRAPDEWYRQVCTEPPDVMLFDLQQHGFAGIYIDGFGFADGGLAVSRVLQGLLHEAPLVSDDGRLRFFSIPLAHRAQG